MILPTTISVAAAAAFITIWHMIRIGSLRMSQKVLHGSGQSEPLARRMRAQLNFVESAPFIIALTGLIEFAGSGGVWLPIVGGIYLLGRVAHAIGMDHDYPHKGRQIGTGITMVSLAGLAIAAVLVVIGLI